MSTKTLTFEEAYEKLIEVVNVGDEEKAKDYLTEHLNEFPEEIQNKIIFSFFEEAVASQAEEEEALNKFKKEGLESLNTLQKLKKGLEEDQKIQNLRKGLGV